MTLDDYRSDLEKLLEETRQSMIVDGPMSIERAILITHAHRKEGMILDELKEVGEMPIAYDPHH